MSKDFRKPGPLGFNRDPSSSRRSGRNSDAGASGFMTIASGVPDVVLKPMVFTGTAATDFATLVARVKELEAAHNALLATLRTGQVIDDSK